MPEKRSLCMNENPAKNRLDTAVPKSDAVERLTEPDKQALELNELIEHTDGPRREQLIDEVQELETDSRP